MICGLQGKQKHQHLVEVDAELVVFEAVISSLKMLVYSVLDPWRSLVKRIGSGSVSIDEYLAVDYRIRNKAKLFGRSGTHPMPWRRAPDLGTNDDHINLESMTPRSRSHLFQTCIMSTAVYLQCLFRPPRLA